MFEQVSVELLPERKALGGGWWGGFGDIDQDIDLDQDVDVDVDNDSCFGDVDVTAFNNASIDQNAR
ncbi:hypothetical protein SAMN05421805_107194 [Saccharopolyspora antimicrobica]|uniref:Uncharacterized protein n=1 Tax=Saccharopolyspora antimicrobica TaxID=455193 RepID=A0A1I5CIM7_9PSEU|nr:hypothetical protein [Saccharopolyspora antimicrobica]RKT88843.1 hypothetical protein ATL45_7286 [Saccharopolyspora antimicrobica]SFN86776.1 hypothetical protein SAMN05421805_107194 [Saccharopolyspora antimicrobica]